MFVKQRGRHQRIFKPEPDKAPAAPKKPRHTTRGGAKIIIQIDRDVIARRAKEIWLKKGCPTGLDEQNWLEAEAQLRAEKGAKP